MKKNAPYKKYIYWLDPDKYSNAIAELRKDKKRFFIAKRQPCEVLYPRREIALAEPRSWDNQCLRQGSWYRASHRNGQHLIVSNSPLDELPLWGSVTLEAFEPPRLADDGDVLEILGDARAPAVLPEGWGLFTSWETQAIDAYLQKEGLELSLQEVFSYYTANHLNFVFPRFFIKDNNQGIIPYSIVQPALVCSACVEIFGILGESFPEKYLIPCPGLKYVKAAPGEHIKVVNFGEDNDDSI